MITTDKSIYVLETEIKPNRYASMVLLSTSFVILVCWILNEIGIFRVGDAEMRIGSIITLLANLVPLSMLALDRTNFSNPRMKFVIIIAASLFTIAEGVLLTFHTTIMLLFPVLLAMLYRSNEVGIIATTASLTATIICPVVGYLLNTWDIPLLQELILIGTDGGAVTVTGGGGAHSLLNVGKIILYLSLPRMMLVGSSSLLLFYNIKLGVDHVNNQIKLNHISQIDRLTGLYNQNTYKEFIKSLEEEKKPKTMGALFFDVNGLKALNDTKGHEYGDILLQRCAKSILNICKGDNMTAFRLGGDEFLLLIEGATEAICNQKVSEWEDQIRKINEENKRDYEGIECSMAVGFDVGTADKIEDLISRADSFMYRNKARMKAMKKPQADDRIIDIGQFTGTGK